LAGSAVTLLSVSLTLPSPASAQATLAGTYKAGPAATVAQVTTWGADCGPRPQDSTDDDRPSVVVKLQGTQLALAFPDRTLRTDACWSPNPHVRLTNATASSNRWRAECATVQGDAKKERGVYTLTAPSNEVLELVEESDYDWQLNESHCVAKVRITQRLARGASAVAVPAPGPAPVAEPEPAQSCVPGALARLRLRPSEAKIAPGQRVCFSARGLDAAGCALPVAAVPLRWELVKPPGVTGTLSNGCFKAAASAAEAEGRFGVVLTSGSLRTEAGVSVTTADLSDITARRSGTGSELEVADGDEGAAELGIQAAVKGSSLAVKLALAALLFGALAALAWVISARLRKRMPQLEDDGWGATSPTDHDPNPPAISPSGRPAPGVNTAEQLICPQCRRGYPGGTARCARDGAVPIPYAEFVKQAQAADTPARTCTACGAQLVAGAMFCGACGAKVRS
jgi:hypothetical protein